jgi:hypothetical protein
LRRLLAVAPSVDPSRYGPDDGLVFQRHQRASLRNGARLDAKGLDWTPAEDAEDRATNCGHTLDREAPLSLADLKGDSSPCDGDGPLDVAPYSLAEGSRVPR